MSVTTRPQRPARVPAFTLSPSHNNQWLNIHGTHAGAHLGYCRPNADHPENFDIAVVVYAESGANVGGDWIRNVVKNQLNPTIRAALQTAFTRRRSMKEPKGRRPAFKSDQRQELLAYYDDRDPPPRPTLPPIEPRTPPHPRGLDCPRSNLKTWTVSHIYVKSKGGDHAEKHDVQPP